MRHFIDFHAIAPEQSAIHDRLVNWGSWCNSNGGPTVSPMFRQAKSNAWQWHAPEIRVTCDLLDAWHVEQHMRKLPRRERDSLVWCYVTRSKPIHACRLLGVSNGRLYELLYSARNNLQKVLDIRTSIPQNVHIAREYA